MFRGFREKFAPAAFGPSFWGVLELVVGPALNLALIPVLVAGYGVDNYGVWVLAMALAALGATGALGAAGYSAWRVAVAQGERDADRLGEVLRRLITLTCMGIPFGVIAVVASFWLYRSYLRQDAAEPLVSELVMFLSVAVFVSQQLDVVASGVIRGLGEFRSLALLELSFRPLVLVGVWGASAGGASLELAVGVFSALTLCVAAAKWRYLLRGARLRRDGHWRTTLRQVLMDVSAARWFWVQGISSALFSSVDRVLVGSILGPTELALYGIACQAGGGLLLFVNGVFQRLLPRVGGMAYNNGGAGVKSLVWKSLSISIFLVIILAAVVWVMLPKVIDVWLPGRLTGMQVSLLWALFVPFLVLSLFVAPHYILMGLGKMKFITALNVFAGGLLMALVGLLVNNFGLEGAAMARGAYALVFLVEWLMLFHLFWWRGSGEKAR